MTDLGTLGLTGSGFEIAAPDVAGLGGVVGTTADAAAVSTGRAVEQVGPETSLQYEASVRYRQRAWRTELTFFVNNIYDNIQKQALDPAGGRRRQSWAGSRSRRRTPTAPCSWPPPRCRCWCARTSTTRASGASSTRATRGFSPIVSLRTAFTYLRTRDTLRPTCRRTSKAARRRRRAGSRSAYAPSGQRWWVEPYVHIGVEAVAPVVARSGRSPHRRGTDRGSIQAFFRNGARARGWIGAGAGRRLQHGGRSADRDRRDAGADPGSRAGRRREFVLALHGGLRLRHRRRARRHRDRDATS